MTFLVTVEGDNIEVRWDRDLGNRDTGIYGVLDRNFDAIHGVEYCSVRRYSATLTVAAHVAKVDEVAEEVSDFLATDEELLSAFRFHAKHLEPVVMHLSNLVRLTS